VISGCSGGGKSTLLAELGRRGQVTVEEPGRRIVKQQLLADGSALPWVDATAFARRTIALALADRTAVGSAAGWVFFDRGLIDAAAGLQHLTGEPTLTALGATTSLPQTGISRVVLARDLSTGRRAASRL
jgi:predicted ATPase